MDKLAQGLAVGIGLASESLHARKEKKKQLQQSLCVPPTLPQQQRGALARSESTIDHSATSLTTFNASTLNTTDGHLDDKSERLLAEKQDIDVPAPPYSEHDPARSNSPNEQVRSFLDNVPPLPQYPVSRLPYPVVVPQRRPGSRSRGFARAYAPDLEGCGISENVFLDFVEDFDKSSQANPWILSVNLAGIAMNFVPIPSVIAMLVGSAIHAGSFVAMEMQGRYRYVS